MHIDSHAVVSPEAVLGEDISVGPFSIIESDVHIGSGTCIGSNVVIAAGSRVGNNCKIFHGAVIGTAPQDLKFEGEYTTVSIGDDTVVREYSTINRGTKASGKTAVGSRCLIMAYVHIAHDCLIGNNVILANAVNMAGHVFIDDFATVGGIVPIHQFVRIGKYAFVGGGFRTPQDVPPYVLAAGEPLSYMGVNTVGLKRNNFSPDLINRIKSVYKTIYKEKMNVSQALEFLKADEEKISEIQEIYRFIRESERGII